MINKILNTLNPIVTIGTSNFDAFYFLTSVGDL